MLGFLWLAAAMGFLSLLTPCVLPMIPITVGFFGRGAAHGRRHTAVALAHAAGIVVVFTALGLLVSASFGAGAVVRLAANPWFNLAIAALFAAFALNLLGVFELTLPERVLARAARTGSGGRAGAALLMGAAFAVTSFTCTAPFVGTLLVLSTQGSWQWPLVGLATYATAFAAPFFLVAVSPTLLARLPRPGAWLLPLKRVLAVAELALAVKFLANVDMVLGWGLLTRDVVIVLWVTASAIAAFLAARLATPQRTPRLVVAGLALAAAAWMLTGLRGRRLGELEAYLPPAEARRTVVVSDRDTRSTASTRDELPWRLNDLNGALASARASGRPVLVDFTAYTCTNCRWMEANMFTRAELRPLLDRYERVRLYTDGIGEPYESQQRLQHARFGTIALPYYALLRSDGVPIASFLGMTRDAAEFGRFLASGLDSSRTD